MNICPACTQPYIEIVHEVGTQAKTMYVHSISAAGKLGVRATGCLLEKNATTLLQLIEPKPLFQYKPPALANNSLPPRPEMLRLLTDV